MKKRFISTLFICLSPSIKETSYFLENPIKHSHNNIHLYTADTAISMRIKPLKERSNSAIYPYSPAGALVQTKTNVTFPSST
jgi:hypothetical protein